ncbi:MAG: DUF1048 domain-containing protein [Erysipelotrichaceae bacterium]
MNISNRIAVTQSDQSIERIRVKASQLPESYQTIWFDISNHMMQFGDRSGGEMIVKLEQAMDILEAMAQDELDIEQAIGDDIIGFCHHILCMEEGDKVHTPWYTEVQKQVRNLFDKKTGKRSSVK